MPGAGGRAPTYFYASGHSAPTACKVVTVGDSIVYSGTSEFSTRILPRGNYAYASSSFPGIGPLDIARRDGQWLTTIRALNPDIVIYEGVGNYNEPLSGVTHNTPAYYEALEDEVQLTLTGLTVTDGVRIGLVLCPLMTTNQTTLDLTAGINTVYRTITAATAGVTLLNLYDLVGGPVFASAWRNVDGVHLSAVGQTMLAVMIDLFVSRGGV